MPSQSTPSITPQLIVSALGWIIAQVVAFGILDAGIAQKIVAIGGIAIPAVWAIASAVHLGQVHAAQIISKPVQSRQPAAPAVPSTPGVKP